MILKGPVAVSVIACALGVLSGTKVSAQPSAAQATKVPSRPQRTTIYDWRVVAKKASGSTSSPASSLATAGPRTRVTQIEIAPSSATVAAGATLAFTASGVRRNGSTAPVTVTWTASGGTISTEGLYTAGQTTGTYQVVAQQAEGTLTATATVTISQPSTLNQVTVAPSSTSVAAGAAQSFSASGVWSDGTTGPLPVTWSTTGGTITTAGLYTAGQTTGTYQVVATHSSGKVGTASVTVTAATSTPSGILIQPGQRIQAAVDANPDGTTFVIGAGIHRMQSVTPKNGNTFTGQTGAILSGARLLTGFVQSGSTWVIGGQTQQGPIRGECLAAYPRCSYPEELFIDDVRMTHVASLSLVGPGKWFFDYAGDQIYLGNDPAGRKVETSVTRAAFTGSANGVTIRSLTIEKYASPAQEGAITQRYGTTGANWLVDNCTVRWNHGTGIMLGPSMHVTNNHVIANGQLGVGGGDDQSGIVVEGNEIAYNNEAGYDAGWEGGGTKFWATTNLIARNNHVHHNYGPGLWADYDNVGMLYENNLVEDNDYAGIFHEISYRAVIRNNIVRRNGHRDPRGWYWRAGILIAASPDVEIYGNTVEDNYGAIVGIQQNRGTGDLGPWLIFNLWVHDNQVRMQVGQSGLVQDMGDNSIFTGRNNHFDRNTYTLGPNARYFVWLNGNRTEGEWQAYGLDASGTFIR